MTARDGRGASQCQARTGMLEYLLDREERRPIIQIARIAASPHLEMPPFVSVALRLLLRRQRGSWMPRLVGIDVVDLHPTLHRLGGHVFKVSVTSQSSPQLPYSKSLIWRYHRISLNRVDVRVNCRGGGRSNGSSRAVSFAIARKSASFSRLFLDDVGRTGLRHVAVRVRLLSEGPK